MLQKESMHLLQNKYAHFNICTISMPFHFKWVFRCTGITVKKYIITRFSKVRVLRSSYEKMLKCSLCRFNIFHWYLHIWKKETLGNKAKEKGVMCWERTCERLPRIHQLWRLVALLDPQELLNLRHKSAENVQDHWHLLVMKAGI